jgi:small subunit ribosomal protein S26e
MPKKRKSGGKSSSHKGQSVTVQCANCGRFVPRSKAKQITKRVNLVDGRIYKELRSAGAIIQKPSERVYYCISCAIHKHQISQRAKSTRKT